ncbi:MAG: Dyp-type peroxidase [Solirubrobacteraceae bacterium]
MTLADVQGNVICGYGSEHAHYLFARITDADAARRWLAARLDDVTYNDSWEDERPDHTLNVAFTHAGLLALGVPVQQLGGLEAFSAGMFARAAVLGDRGASAPERWEPGLRDTHLLVTLTAWTADHLVGPRAELDEHLTDSRAGFRLTYPQVAETLSGAREHFGFSDGFSQPAIAGASTGPRDGEGTLTRWRRWRDLRLGEFVLGYEDGGGLCSPAPAGPLGQDATFMVIRKLEQDVFAFRAYVAEQGRRLGRDPDWVAAKLVGRWQNGSPLARYPDRPGPAAADKRAEINRFRYGLDPSGLACPVGAHVRRANPRDALGWEGRLTQRHRILRRGMSYGPPLAAGASKPDCHERGLMFVSFQSSLERQFEFIQKQWLADGNVFGLGADRDPIVGSGNREGSGDLMVIQGSPPLYLNLPAFVSTRGGDYFLLPGRTGLRALATGQW